MKKLLTLSVFLTAAFFCAYGQVTGTLQPTTAVCNVGCNASSQTPFCATCGPNVTGSCTEYELVLTVAVANGETIIITVTNANCGAFGQFDSADEIVFRADGNAEVIVAGNVAQTATRCYDNTSGSSKNVTFGYRANRLDEFATYSYTISAGTGAGCIALPIALTDFKARINEKSVGIFFSTATERNNAHFSIERSANGSNFTEIGRVAGKGTTTTKQDYTFADERPLKGINYYRLKQVDFDGTASYSGVVSVQTGRVGGITVAPSPVVDQLNVRFEATTEESGRYEVFDQAGRLVLNGAVAEESSELNLEVAALMTGIYTLRVTNGRETMTKQFRKE